MSRAPAGRGGPGRPSAETWGRFAEAAQRLFGLALSAGQLDLLRVYVDLLEAWSQRMNLVSASGPEDLVFRHVLDSLAPAVLLPPGVCADVGSGAGLPGIPLAVVRPEPEWLIESRRRRASFLRHTARTMGLTHVRVFEGRAEDFVEPDLSAIVARGVEPGAVLAIGRVLLRPGGRAVLMLRAAQALPPTADFRPAGDLAYELPGGERHVVIALERCST